MTADAGLGSRLARWLRGGGRGAMARAMAEDPVMLLEERIMLDAEAHVTIDGPATAPMGGAFAVTLTFDNIADGDPGSNTGYGPYIDLLIPTTGKDGGNGEANDGITFGSATYLGVPLQSTLLTFDVNGQAIHPFARDSSGNPRIVTGTPGDTLAVLTLPFGSFTPDQTAAVVTVNLTMSPLADYDPGHVVDQLTLQAQGGFSLGRDALDNPVLDPPVLQQPPVTLGVSPSLLTLTKVSSAPEGETATGPNFLRTYTIDVDIATGQTIDLLHVEDLLPRSIVYVSSVVTVGSGTLVDAPAEGVPVDPADSLLSYNFGSVTGVSGVDARIVVTFYVSDVEGGAGGGQVIDPVTGLPTQTNNDVRATGLFQPIDGRDPLTVVFEDATLVDNIIVNRAIAVQKTASILDNNSTGLSAGDVVVYTLNIQLSDYFTLGDINLADLLSDGQRVDTSFLPTFTVIERGTATGVQAFSGLVASGGEFSGGAFTTAFNGVSGQTVISIGLSQELIAQGLLGGDGVLAGGRTQAGDAAALTAGSSIAITFRAVVQPDFVSPQTFGQAVSQGDRIRNDVEVTATVRDNATQAPTGSTIDDDSAVVLTVPAGHVNSKEVVAVNGAPPVLEDGRPVITQGDSITFRISYTLPNSSIDRFSLVDYLPLPILQATSLTQSAGPAGTIPGAGEWNYGSGDTFSGLLNAPTPVVSMDANSNAITFDYGSYSLQQQPGNPPAQSSVVEILFTVRASDLPFADRLQLTNLVTAYESGSQGATVSTSALGQFQLSQPDLVITKGVVDYLGSNTVVFDGSRSPPGVSFAGAVGNAGAAAFTGQITDAALTQGAIDANLRGVDAGDKVTFAILVNNDGTGRNGAFDVQFRDTLPAGFGIPSDMSGLNLKVTTGNGTPIAYTLIGSGLFDGGIRLTDNGTSGSIAPDTDGTGVIGSSTADIIVITYDLVALDSVNPRQTWTNTATLFAFAALPGGSNFLNEALVDSSTVSTRDPLITKAVIGSSHSFTSGSNLAIGETVTFRITVLLPEGTANSLVLSDILPANATSILTPLSATLVSVGSGLSGAGIPAVGSQGTLSGQTFTFNFGDVVNSGDNIAGNDSIVIDVTARVTDDARNARGDTATNTGRMDWVTTLETGVLTPGNLTAAAAVRFVTPDLTLAKSVNPTTADGGDTVTYRLTIANPNATYATTAFNLNLTDASLAALGFTDVTILSVTPTGAVNAVADVDSGLVVRVTADSLNAGGTIIVEFSARVSENAVAGSTLTNTARITDYATLPGGDPNARVITNEPPATATLTIASPGIVKQLITTSIGDDANPKVQIGETATFDIIATLPDGLTEQLVISDLLPTGASTLNFVSATLISIGGNSTAGATSGGNISGSLLGVGAEGVIAGGGKSASFTLGTLYTAAAPGNSAADQIIIRVTVVVPDVPENTAADDVVTNTATAVFSTGSRQATSSLDIVEPNVGIVKSAVPVQVQAGNIISYSFTLRNNGDGIAYDLTVADPLHPDILRVGQISFSGVTSGTANNFSDIYLTQLRPGESLTVSYQALVLDTATHGSSIVNTASTTYDSLPGVGSVGRVPSPPPSSTVSIPVIGPVQVDKSVILTSVNGDTSPNVVIGEIVTYQIVTTLPNGTISLSVSDLLPTGLQYVVGSASFVSAFGSNTPPVGYQVSVSGQQVTFDFGTLVNPPFPGGDDRVIVTLQALVRDVGVNFQGANLINPVGATTSLGLFNDPTPPVVTIIEPRLQIDKSALVNGGTAGDAGDLVTFTVSIRHTGTSNADARDFVVSDLLPPGLTLVGVAQLSGSGAAGASVDPNAPANSIRVTGATLALGQELIVTYQARIDDANLLPSTITNTASVNWDSLPGVGGRVNSASDPASIDVTGPQSLVKTITGTSDSLTGTDQFNPLVTDLVIGERVDFQLLATIPEGVLGPVILTDTLLAGFGTLDLVPGSVRVEIGGVVHAFTPTITDTNGDGIGDLLTFNLGTIALPGDNDPSNNTIRIQYSAFVPDVPVNFAGPGRVLMLPATLDTPLGKRADQVGVEIVEPELVLNKTANAITGVPGDIITYRLTLSHAGDSSAAARDIIVVDDLSTGDLILVPGSLIVVSGPGTVNGGGVSVSIGTLALGEETVIEYRAIVGSVPPGAGVPNIAAADFDSVEGPGGRPDRVTDTFTFGVPNLDKIITGTSLADTGSEQFRPTLNDLAIGEILFYDIVVTLPTGDTGVLVTDRLLALGDTGVMELVGTPTILLGAGVSATNPNPTLVQTDLDGDGIADRLAWDFGTVTFTGSGDNRIVISVAARVADVAANVSGDLLVLAARLDYMFGNVVDVVAVDLVEPGLGIEKIVTPVVGEAGVVVGYQVTIRNLGAGPAYDLALTDVSDPGLIPQGPATLLQGGISTQYVSASDVVVARLMPGEVVIVSYSARIADTVLPGSVLPNTVSTGYDSLPGADAGQRSYAPVADDAAVTVTPTTQPVLVKSIPVPPTSDPNTGDAQFRPGVTDLGIGESARVELTAVLPRGTVNNVIITDQLTTADAKLGFVAGSVEISFGGVVLDAGDYSVTLVDSDGDGIADSVRFQFASLTVPGSADPLTAPLVIRYTVVALDVPANAGGDQLDLPASLSYDTATGPIQPLIASAGVDLVEPQLLLTKSTVKTVSDSGGLHGLLPPADPLSGTAGDIFTYTLTISQAPGSSGPAYDLALSDIVPNGLSLISGSVVASLPGVNLSVSGNSISATVALLLPGESFTITYQGRILDATFYDTAMPNRVDLSYDAFAGPGGRADSASANAEIFLQGGGTVVKTVVSTSNPNSGSGAFEPGVTDLTIGEEVTTRLTAVLAEGTTHVVITDRLPSGPNGVLELMFIGTPVLGANVIAEHPNPTPTLLDTDGDGFVDSFRFDFGQVTVLGDNVIDVRDTISIEVTARVPDDPRNTSGGRLDAPVLLDFGTGTAQASVPLDIVEPQLVVDKIALTPDRFLGQIASYEIRVYHGPNSVVAADVAVIDTLAPGLTLVPGSLIVVSSPPGIPVTIDGTTVSIPVLPLGTELVIRFDAQIGFTVSPAQPLPNTATVTYDQVPGAGGRPAVTEDTAYVNVLPGDVPRREQPAGHWLRDRYVERLPRIDGIYSGTAQAGSRLMLTLVDGMGAPSGSTAVTADAGGNWIALMPSAITIDRHDWQDRVADSSLFRDMVHAKPAEPEWDADRTVRVGAYVPDGAHRLQIDHLSAGNMQPDKLLGAEPSNNLRTYFAPAWRDELFIEKPLSIDRVFEDLAGNAISRDFAAAKEPLGFALNTFNAELLAAGVGADGR